MAMLASALVTGAAVFYVAPSGNDSTGVIDDPTRPFKTPAAALTRVGDGDEVRLAEGRYTVTPGIWPSVPLQLTGRTNVVILGAGPATEIYGEGPGDFFLLLSCGNVRVEGITFKGNKPPVEENPLQLFGMLHLAEGNSSVLINDCRFIDFGNHGVTMLTTWTRAYNVTVANCYFYNGGDTSAGILENDGAAVSGIGPGWIVTNNVIENCVRGIEIEGAFVVPVGNILVANNRLTNILDRAIMLFATGPSSTHYTNITIANNRIDNVIAAHEAAGISIFGGEDIRVIGNVIRNVSGTGILVDALQQDLKGAIIASNTVTKAGARGIQAWQFPGRRLSNVKITHNTVLEARHAAVLIHGQDIEVSENVQLHGTGAGVEVSGFESETRNVIISGNTIASTGGVKIYHGIGIGTNTFGTVIVGNRIGSDALEAFVDAGIGTVFERRFVRLGQSNGRWLIEGGAPPGVSLTVERRINSGAWQPLPSTQTDWGGYFSTSTDSPPGASVSLFRFKTN